MTPSELFHHRHDLGLTEAQFAAYLGVKSASTISGWEHGKRPIPQPIQKLIKALQKLEMLERPVLPGIKRTDKECLTVEVGFCQCGCNQLPRIAPRTDRQKKWIKGQYLAFIKGHNLNTRKAKR